MVRITLKEATKLNFIALYPKNPHSRKLVTVLKGKAKDIALTLLGQRQSPDPEIQQVAKIFQQHAVECARRGKLRQKKILQTKHRSNPKGGYDCR